jgi:hypothetical protein
MVRITVKRNQRTVVAAEVLFMAIENDKDIKRPIFLVKFMDSWLLPPLLNMQLFWTLYFFVRFLNILIFIRLCRRSTSGHVIREIGTRPAGLPSFLVNKVGNGKASSGQISSDFPGHSYSMRSDVMWTRRHFRPSHLLETGLKCYSLILYSWSANYKPVEKIITDMHLNAAANQCQARVGVGLTPLVSQRLHMDLKLY